MEKQVAKTILEKPTTIVLAGVKYHIKPTTIATLVKTSEQLIELPKEALNPNNLFSEVFKNAKHGHTIARTLAILILGVKPETAFKRLLKRVLKRCIGVDKISRLEQKIYHCKVSEIAVAFQKVLQSLNVQDFFVIITFLTDLTLTKPTKKVM